MAEAWKPVPSYPGMLASDEGRLLLPPSYAPLKKGGFRAYMPEPVLGGVCRASKQASHVYRGLWSRRYGNIKVHRAICEAFHGPAPFEGAVVLHIDEDGLNNRADNLRWGTQRENLNMPKVKAYHRSRTGANSPRARWAAKRGIA